MLDNKTETFLQVVRLKSYTLAAQALHMTQPAVTQHIRKLEAHYGCRLIDSAKHSVRLTAAGKLLHQALCLQKANEEQIAKRLLDEERHLKIGATLSLADYYLPGALAKQMLRQANQFSVYVGNTQSLVEKLSSGALDCAFIEGIFDRGLFDCHVFRYADFVPFVSAAHPLAAGAVSTEALRRYPLALREEGSGTREVLSACLQERGDSLSLFADKLELGSFTLIKEVVKSSLAISFAYKAVICRELGEKSLCIVNAEEYQFVHPLRFVYRKGSLREKEYRRFYTQVISGLDEEP